MTQPVEIELHVGHYGDGTGSRGYVDEVQYARKFIKRIYEILIANKVAATFYEDKISKNQTQNINHLVSYHNKDRNGLIVSGHLNSTTPLTDQPIGGEVLYSTQKDLAAKVAKAMSDASGLKNRGAIYRNNIGVLTKTYEPGILIEFGFVNSKKDIELLDQNLEAICLAIAKVLAAAIGHPFSTPAKEEGNEVETSKNTLDATGVSEAKKLFGKLYEKGVFSVDHSDKIEQYSDGKILSLLLAYLNRSQ
ncbi:N-acetylmuramoyl-L-alanine amidase [Solibacillus sp. R5-41]|uniref:N-acetylmuramoyl-L-alanine amidase n=1 Tax=Solibacillus sp. R5-41 TaxID=2048654 RepID=UPI0012FE6EDC|nr:N-acetylmuramoyl-L-alanine amidase [Solibacillus sp. R5-41]